MFRLAYAPLVQALRVPARSIGPNIPAEGVWSEHAPLMQSQIAATVAAAVGEYFPAAVPKAAPALPILRPSKR